jgi:CubicO group peptidase (beta-lactamase class C family)
MPRSLKAFRAGSMVLPLVLGSAAALSAQAADSLLDPAPLRRSSLTWTQAEREFGYPHWGWIFSGRVVERGSRPPHPLPPGAPLAAFAPGTPGARELERFIAEQNVAGLIVLQDGKVRLERYARGYGPAGRWISQSVAKSITSTLAGAAVKDGFIESIDDPVTKYVPALAGSGYDGVTIRQVMTMTSGVRWNEDYTDPNSDIVQLQTRPIMPGVNATVSALKALPREAEPGTRWHYNTAETHLLGIIVTAATRRPLAIYLSEKIWGPYGMEQSALWQTDRTHHELAGCCLHAGLRDFARFGQFVLDGGKIDGRSIVPDGWFEEATRGRLATTTAGRRYGYQWWVFDDGTFAAIGIHGQAIVIDRARRLVVAINSVWPVPTDPARSAARQAILATIDSALDAESRR